ncbi:MAG TPA: DUF1499 domain-containing protein [Candidatus Sulfobium mesophilum]|nr:DUF1499 domain-containing protein [Candidatus Sulfobium mesophilum]
MARDLNAYASFVASAGFGLALVSALAAVLAGVGTRFEIWNFRMGLMILKWSAYGGLAATAVSLAGGLLAFRRGFGFTKALIGLILGVALFLVPAYWLQKAHRLPPIHDITTDTVNPPLFVSIVPLRKDASNPPDYGGPQIASQQLKAYPDIAPLVLDVPKEAAFEIALAAARRLRWEIIDADRAAGRIEASDTTFWFGFRDDIVIRVEESGQGSRIDVRSVSRVGISDIGTNATRIRRFLTEMGKK